MTGIVAWWPLAVTGTFIAFTVLWVVIVIAEEHADGDRHAAVLRDHLKVVDGLDPEPAAYNTGCEWCWPRCDSDEDPACTCPVKCACTACAAEDTSVSDFSEHDVRWLRSLSIDGSGHE